MAHEESHGAWGMAESGIDYDSGEWMEHGMRRMAYAVYTASNASHSMRSRMAHGAWRSRTSTTTPVSGWSTA
jgi:hypothetical protein